MPHQFPLRLIFVVMTTIAICLGSNLALYTFGGIGPSDHLWAVIYSAANLPMYLVCAVGAYLVFENRSKLASASRLALAALCIMITWIFLSPLVRLLYGAIRSAESAFLIGSIVQTISAIMSGLCWALMITALFRAAQIMPSERPSDESNLEVER